MLATRVGVRLDRALEPCASSTSRTIPGGPGGAYASRFDRGPVLFTVPPSTVSLTRLVTGIASPVSIDSSIAAVGSCRHWTVSRLRCHRRRRYCYPALEPRCHHREDAHQSLRGHTLRCNSVAGSVRSMSRSAEQTNSRLSLPVRCRRRRHHGVSPRSRSCCAGR